MPDDWDWTWGFHGTVERVVDGDTFYAKLDLGFYIYHVVSIRLKDIDAPELFRGEPEERQRGAMAKDILSGILPVGTSISVVTHKNARSFNRYVADVVYVNSEGTFALKHVLLAHPSGLWK